MRPWRCSFTTSRAPIWCRPKPIVECWTGWKTLNWPSWCARAPRSGASRSSSMSYSLEFVESALKEWRKLALPIRDQFKKKLAERLEHPRVPSAKLHNLPDCYKIKLRTAGYRLVYQVNDKVVVVTVIAVGKRDKLKVYRAASERIE